MAERVPAVEQAPEILVDDARPEDVEGIQHVYYDTWLATYPNVEHDILRGDIEYKLRDALSKEKLLEFAEHLQNLPEGVRVLVARDGERIVGVSRIKKDEKRNFLKTLYVLPEYQGRGVGTALWNEAHGSFDPKKETELWVTAYNQKAVDFYKKIGFVETGGKSDGSNPLFQMRNGAMMPAIEMVKVPERS